MEKFKACMVLLARGGSKGILKKNLEKIDDLPLVCRTTKCALDSKIFDDLIISSDDPEILAAVDQFPVKQHKRSGATSSDSARSEDALREIFNDNQIISGHCFLLQCTTPFVTKHDLRNVYQLALEFPNNCVVSGYLDSIHHWIFNSKRQEIKPVAVDMLLRGPRQSNPSIFTENGGIYAFPVSEFLRSNSRFTTNNIPYVMDKYSSIDIDTEADLKIAKFISTELHKF